MKRLQTLCSLALTIGFSCAALSAEKNYYAPTLGAQPGEPNTVYVGYDVEEKEYSNVSFNYQLGVAVTMAENESCRKIVVSAVTGEVGCVSNSGIIAVGKLTGNNDKREPSLELILKEVKWNTDVVEIGNKKTKQGYDIWSLQVKSKN
jgi:hypothetical protein